MRIFVTKKRDMIRKLIFTGVLAIMSLMYASCAKNDDGASAALMSSSDYCVMFYCSGGDPEHTACFNGYKDAMEKILPETEVSVTWLFKPDDSTQATTRFFTQDGMFHEDTEWNGGTDYDITSHANLSEFITWSASKFPGKKYVLVTVGHGNPWTPQNDNPSLQSMMYDGTTKKSMTSTALALAIGNSGVEIETLLTNNCLQGSVEALAEWNGYVDYVVYCSSYLPDIGGDYPYFIKLLDRCGDMREVLKNYVAHCGDIFNGVTLPFDGGGVSLSAMEMRYFDGILETSKKIFEEMGNSLERTSTSTDSPCVFGRTYAAGYQEAMRNSLQMDMIESIRGTRDMYDFIYNCVVYTGHPELMTLVAEFKDKLDQAVILNVHDDILGDHKVSFNICVSAAFFNEENMEIYKSCKFDQATGWSDFYVKLYN